ncbi:MAG: SDR family oxidoreductase [Gemmatimonadales bacterium]|nr:SDR family oxidoreductase [Gemmatimonadales bacterium]
MINRGRYLDGRHAIVTGGGRGIGQAVADALASLGARVTLMGRDVPNVERHAALLRSEHGTDAFAVGCDVTDAESVSAAFGAARTRFGDAHVLVNNAGQAESATFADTTVEMWNRMLAVNLTGQYLCIQEVLPAMLRAKSGRIVNLASTAGLKGYNRVAAYCASKHGVIGLTRALAIETAKHGITVNAVCPGYTDTDMAGLAVKNVMSAFGKDEQEARAMVVRTIPRGSMIQPDEVAHAVAWLCSPDAAAITGQAIAVAGGEVM